MTDNISPAVILGSGRSGTNMLRDLLTSLPAFATWPCDEINYIWRHGNRAFATDAFSPEMATPEIARYIRAHFAWVKRRYACDQVVEKTCANTLRVGFVNAILPDARFVHIIRDGRDVAASAAERWKAPMNLGYVASKARFVPKMDIPFYAYRYGINRLRRLANPDGKLDTWGPKFEGMDAVFNDHSLAVACAKQWSHCVASTQRQLSEIDPARVLNLRYEAFVESPEKEFGRLLTFLNVSPSSWDVASAVSNVSTKSIGRWRRVLHKNDIDALHKEIGPFLDVNGYK